MKDLLAAVIGQIEIDLDKGDFIEIEELLKHIPEEILQAYLPEGCI